MTALTEIFGEPIYIYSRKQAIEDGYQWKLDGEHEQMARQLYKYPVYLTTSVVDLIQRAVANEKHCNDFDGVLWDILYMSRSGCLLSPDTTQFQVIITGVGRKRYHTMLIKCGATDFDDPTPALTIMLPEEN